MSAQTGVDEKRELFSKYNKLIDDLYAFRDKYYIVNEDITKNADDRNQELNGKLSELAAELEAIDADKFPSKASRLVLIGRAFNVLPDYSPKACEALTKAIKLDPKSVDAWNYLGECYWKSRDFEMCRNCFERSLGIESNKLSLRGMAMVTRQLINVPLSKEQLLRQQQENPATSQHMRIKQLLEESIRYAKEAIKLDPKDGMSWYILANCYVSMFFSPFGQQNSALLKQAFSSYGLALKDESVASLQSDLYFNKSMISLYEENWSDTLECLCKALKLDPHWLEVRENLKGTVDFLVQISDLLEHKGKLKAKKFQAMVESIKKSDLGPYGGSTFIPTGGVASEAQKPIELKEACIKDLTKGLNVNKVLVGKVICGLPAKNTGTFSMVCFTCCIADANGDCAALTIYNLAGGEGLIIGQSVAIPEPWFESVDVQFKLPDSLRKLDVLPSEEDRLDIKFSSVRVENPAVLVVNGRKWTKDKISSAFFVPKVIAD